MLVSVCVLVSVHAVGQRPQRVVLSLQLPVPLLQLSDLFSQKLHLLPHRQHQVTLHQVLHTHTHMMCINKLANHKARPTEGALCD